MRGRGALRRDSKLRGTKRRQQNKMSIDLLPDELLAACFAALSARSLTRAARACTRWRGIAGRNELWRALCSSRWPSTTRLKVLCHRTFYMQRARRQRPWRISDYTLLLDGELNGGAFSLSLPLASATADGGILTWACTQLAWQTGTVPVFVLESVALWCERTQQLAQLDCTDVGGTAAINEEDERDDEVWEGWRDGTIKPYHLLYADFGIDDFVNEPPVGLHMPPAVRNFAWRLRYMNGTMIFALVSCAFDDNEGPPHELTWPDAQENELQPFISPVSEAVLLQGVSLMCRRCS